MNDEHLTRAEFLAHIGPMRDDIKELVDLQRIQNSRVGKAETRIAVLEDRSPSASRLESNGVSAVISGVITALGIWFNTK